MKEKVFKVSLGGSGQVSKHKKKNQNIKNSIFGKKREEFLFCLLSFNNHLFFEILR